MDKLKIFIRAIIFLFLIFNVEANETAETFSISGKVLNANTSKPIVAATVQVLGTSSGAITNSEGSFTIKNIKGGVYSIKFSAVGFETFVQSNVYVSNVKPTYLEIYLPEKVIQIPELEVRGKYFERFTETTVSTQAFSSEEIRRAPGVQEDVIRITALLPGVSSTQPGRNDLVVRGGAPFENLIIVDNIEIPNINHFGSPGSSGGPLSIVNIDFIRNVQFSAGGFGAKYGDKVSSLTKIDLYNGNSEKFGGKATLSATGFGLNLEGPINSNGSFFFSARRSYLDLVFKAAKFAFIPEYWDFQGKINYKIDSKNTLSFLTIGALDNVLLNNETIDDRFKNSQVAVPKQNQYYSGISLRHLLNNGYFIISLGRSYSYYYIFQNDSNLTPILKNNSREGENSLKIDFDVKLSKSFELSFGNQSKFASLLKYNIFVDGKFRTDQYFNPKPLSVDTSFSAFKNSSYVSFSGSLGKLRLALGVRMDYFNFIKNKLYLAPRFNASYMIDPVSTLLFSIGRYFQSPSYVWMIGDKNQSLNAIQSDLVVLGYEHTPFEDVKVQLESYYKIYRNYPARVYRPQSVLSPSGFEDVTTDIPFGLEPLVSEGKGWSRGIELLIQKRYNPELPLFGILSVTFSQTKFKSLDGIERISNYDSPLIFNLSLGYRFNPEWEVVYKYRASIGRPTTPFTPNGFLDYSLYNQGDRLPTFHATDIRIDKRWFLSKLNIVTYLDIQNLFNTKNVTAVRWNPRERNIEYQKSFGILPSIGVYLEF
ncbi:MAG: TonB-dependent receptor [Candidatus Kapaibacteriales bacterium]